MARIGQTTYVSSTQLTAAITAGDLAAAASASAMVLNKTPGGGASGAVSFAVTNPVPVLSDVSPSNIAAGASAFTLTVNGSGFVATSSVLWNGNARTTTYVSANQLTVAINAADVAIFGTAFVAVINPTPGGGASTNAVFTITTNPAPAVSAIQPNVAAVNSSAFTLTVSGNGFVAASTVQWHGSGV